MELFLRENEYKSTDAVIWLLLRTCGNVGPMIF